jgi:lysophospholipase L1-like esterase
MRTGRTFTTMTLLLVLIGFTLTVPAVAGPPKPRPVYYLALGDSLSRGVQPLGPENANVPTDFGYVDQIFATLKSKNPKLELVKIGCPVTETTVTMLRGGGTCKDDYSRGAQVAEAAEFLRKNRGFVTLVTIDIGANDVETCANLEILDIDRECLRKRFIDVATHLPVILTALRAAAGPHVPIVGMNYYNPFLAAFLAPGGVGVDLAQESNEIVASFNGLLGAIYRFFRVPVADVAAAFQTTNDDPVFVPEFGAEIPVNVATICALTYMCPGANIHATTEGYFVIKEAFLATGALP